MIIGNLGQTPELKYTQSQKAVLNLSVATKEPASVNGQKSEKVEWHKVQVWDKLAEMCGKYLVKGSSVYVEGRLQTREWNAPNGEKKYVTEIIASNVQFLGSPQAKASQPVEQAPPPVVTPEDIPF